MRTIAKYSAGFCVLLAAAACDSGVITSRDTAENTNRTGPTLADVKAAIDAPPVISTGSMIDPAAKNIDPFAEAYTSEQRDAFTSVAANTANEDGYLDGSMTEAETLLKREVPQIELAGYKDGLTCAARFDVAAKNGALSAHRGQEYARDVLNATVIGYENTIRAQNEEDEVKQLIDEYRSNSYVNYILIRDQLRQDIKAQGMDGNAMLAQGEACYEALGLVLPETDASNALADDPQQEAMSES